MKTTSITNREIWRIATPIMLGNLAQTVITFTDTAFLGHLGTNELSASMMAKLRKVVKNGVLCSLVLGAIGMTYFEAVSGTGNTAAAMSLEFGVLVAYVLYVYLMTNYSTIASVWTAEWFYNIVIGIISFLYIWKADWRKKKI